MRGSTQPLIGESQVGSLGAFAESGTDRCEALQRGQSSLMDFRVAARISSESSLSSAMRESTTAPTIAE